MKFRFCGDGDCPDWILAEIYSNLSVISSVKLRILTQMVAKSILGEDINEEKLKDTFSSSQDPTNALKSTIACLRFLLINATRFSTETSVFSEELQQLGLPKEHSTAICRVLSEYTSDIRKLLADQSLTVNEFDEASFNIPEDTIGCAQLNIKIKNEIIDGIPQATNHIFNITEPDLAILIKDLKVMQNIMDKMNNENK